MITADNLKENTLTFKEAMNKMGISRSTLLRFLSEHKIRVIRGFGVNRIIKADVTRFISDQLREQNKMIQAQRERDRIESMMVDELTKDYICKN